MRYALVNRELEHFRIDQDQAHLVRIGLIQQGQNRGINADRFTRARCARHEQVRHLGKISHHWVTSDVFTQADA